VSRSPLLCVSGLEIAIRVGPSPLAAVNGITLSLDAGECACLVGESGCGKSLTALSLLGLLPSPPFCVNGSITFQGRNLLDLTERGWRSIRGREIAMIFQEPMTALNPVFTVGAQIGEAITTHEKVPSREVKGRVETLLVQVGISDPEIRLGQYPHELSGGLRQRVMIAMALACGPRILLADEPTTAIDVSIQAQILDLLHALRAERGLGLLLITHNLGVVARIADRVLIMYAGRIVEEAPVRDLFAQPLHPYTRGLLASLPPASGRKHGRLTPIPGAVPSLGEIPGGCAFHPRCPQAVAACSHIIPSQTSPAPGRKVACHLYPA